MIKRSYFFYIGKFLIALLILAVASCKKDSDNSNKDGGLNKKSTGSTANDLLSEDKYKSLVVELQYVSGFEPTETAKDNLKTFLQTYLNKPDGITFKESNITSPSNNKYSVDDIIAIEDANRNEYTADEKMAAYFLFLDGEYSENSGSGKVLGIAYRNTSMVIFEKTIRDFSGGLGQPSTSLVESTVLNHEFGHILGLVNVGTEMQTDHQDEAHGKHCDVDDCLMYYATETSDFFGNLIGGSVPELDSLCQADLKANGGK